MHVPCRIVHSQFPRQSTLAVLSIDGTRGSDAERGGLRGHTRGDRKGEKERNPNQTGKGSARRAEAALEVGGIWIPCGFGVIASTPQPLLSNSAYG